jgi:hypothetical protein
MEKRRASNTVLCSLSLCFRLKQTVVSGVEGSGLTDVLQVGSS